MTSSCLYRLLFGLLAGNIAPADSSSAPTSSTHARAAHPRPPLPSSISQPRLPAGCEDIFTEPREARRGGQQRHHEVCLFLGLLTRSRDSGSMACTCAACEPSLSTRFITVLSAVAQTLCIKASRSAAAASISSYVYALLPD